MIYQNSKLNNITKVEREYHALKSIKDKLSFDPTGRPGAAKVRADQARISEKLRAYAQKRGMHITYDMNKNISGISYYKKICSNARFNSADMIKKWRNNRHDERQAQVDRFLRTLEHYKRDIVDGSPRQLFGLPVAEEITYSSPSGPRLGQIIKLGDGWFARADETITWDNNCYSKGWHRAYGGKKIVDARYVDFKRMTPRGPEHIRVDIDSWRGNWLAKAITEAGLAPDRKNLPSLKIRLNKAYDAKLIAEKRGYKIYSRTLVGAHVDYVIQSPLGMVYHDTERANLVRGLHDKIRAKMLRLRLPGGKIDWSLCKKLGFCSAGIKSFCDAFGFDTRKSYSARDIYDRVKRDMSKAAPYFAELKTLAQAVNFDAPELH